MKWSYEHAVVARICLLENNKKANLFNVSDRCAADFYSLWLFYLFKCSNLNTNFNKYSIIRPFLFDTVNVCICWFFFSFFKLINIRILYITLVKHLQILVDTPLEGSTRIIKYNVIELKLSGIYICGWNMEIMRTSLHRSAFNSFLYAFVWCSTVFKTKAAAILSSVRKYGIRK